MRLRLAHLIYLALLAFAVIFLWQAQGLPGAQSRRDIGPAAFPEWIAVAMIGLILVDAVASRHLVRPTSFSDLGLAAAVAALLGLSIWLATQFGFFRVLPFALFVGLWLAGSRHHLANVAFSVLLPAVLWLLFDRVLLIPIAGM